ncbi:hypothetical protein EV702DRAFT_1098037 [Suillus placidus]|uniref:Uncharacterized protein n=1 Tax=Suillus placidus TaxID=48579 RepID=A0A9P6ZWS6_9AGAM|nr:hypothetical protein EV702DRAFT_1098037 [Suillus placidus]
MDGAIAVVIGGCRAALCGSVLFGSLQSNCEDLAQILDIILDPADTNLVYSSGRCVSYFVLHDLCETCMRDVNV